MIFLVCLCQILVMASSDIPPLPPLNIELVYRLLKWNPVDEDRNTTYTVQYSRLNEDKWKNVPSCIQISQNSCDVNSTTSEAEFGCVKLRVQAQRNGLTSETVEACNRNVFPGDCTPQVRLSSRPGSLTVHLSRDHNLVHEYAKHAQHDVCYSRLGQAPQSCRKSSSSVVLPDLDEGQTYCVQVQFLHFLKPVGLPSCSQCLDIPHSLMSKQSWIIMAVFLSVATLAVASIMAYVIIFHRKKFKSWFRPEQTPYSLTLPLHDVLVSSPVEEHCFSITDFIPKDQNN